MSAYDFKYICRTVAHLSGIPVRVYQGEEELCRYFPAALPRDPLEPYKDGIFAISEHVGYYATPLFHYYGVLNTGDIKLIVGPTSQIMADGQKLRALAFELDIPKNEVPAFVDGMNAIVRMRSRPCFR